MSTTSLFHSPELIIKHGARLKTKSVNVIAKNRGGRMHINSVGLKPSHVCYLAVLCRLVDQTFVCGQRDRERPRAQTPCAPTGDERVYIWPILLYKLLNCQSSFKISTVLFVLIFRLKTSNGWTNECGTLNAAHRRRDTRDRWQNDARM